MPRPSTQETRLLDAFAHGLRTNLILVLGSIAWWGCHFLLLWNADVATSDTVLAGYDGRFTLTVAGTVVAFGIVALIARVKPNLRLCRHPLTFIVYALCSILALILVFAPLFTAEPMALVVFGALLSGMSNSLMLTVYGELHGQLELRILPGLFALETGGGIVVFFLAGLASAPIALAAAIILVLGCTLLFLSAARASRSQPILGSAEGAARLDMGAGSLVALAVLTGVGYGMVRTFIVGAEVANGAPTGIFFECAGTCLSVILLGAVFLLQRRLSLFELCLICVVAFVATGLLLMSLNGTAALIPTVINQGGFACFFVLIWYFAASLASRKGDRHLTFLIALLLFASQLGQLLGALVPPQFSNMLSTSLVYLILMASMGFMYSRSRRAATLKDVAAGEIVETAPLHPDGPSLNAIHAEMASDRAWAQALGLSPREEEIALLLLERTPYRNISEQLFISENTVKTHVRNIYKKAGVSSREELLETLTTLTKKG